MQAEGGALGWVALGSAIGACARFMIGPGVLAPVSWLGASLLVNVVGAFAVGAFAARFGTDGLRPASPRVRQFLLSGVAGGFTTFSLFSLEWLQWMLQGRWGMATAWLAVSLLAWGAGLAAGYLVARPRAIAR